MNILISPSIGLYSVVLQETYKAKCQSEVNINQPCKGAGYRNNPKWDDQTWNVQAYKMAFHATANVEERVFKAMF